jgi:succinate-acetate transporter protein
MAEERAAPVAVSALANPAALGLAAFALTTFILSSTNAMGANGAPLLAVYGFALFYGGLGQFCAGMWEFKTGNTFGATAFTTYGAFWMGVAAFLTLVLFGKVTDKEVLPSLGWILLAFAIFNTYMTIWSLRINLAVFLVFLTLEITEILLFVGAFNGDAPGKGITSIGGYVGILTALVAWYTSAATVANSMRPRPILPVGRAVWMESGGPMAVETSGRPVVR